MCTKSAAASAWDKIKNLTIVFIKRKLVVLGYIKDFLEMRVSGLFCKLDFTT